MNTHLRYLLLATAVMTSALACSSSTPRNSSREVSHTESDTTGWFGGRTHAANTVYKNDDGSTSIQTETTTVKGNTTTITRDRKTTSLAGQVHTDSETRTIVRGTDNIRRESRSSN
jgi:hypothetical protein